MANCFQHARLTSIHTALGALVIGIGAAAMSAGCSSSGGGSGGPDSGDPGVSAIPDVVVDFTDLPVASVDGRTVTFRPGLSQRPAARGGAAVTIDGLEDAVLDFTGVELRGMAETMDLDLATGHGVVLRNCKDVEIRGGVFGGYRGCIVVEDSENIRVVGSSFSRWFGQRLQSTPFAEDQTDWLRPHENDEGEWLRKYGAAISMTGTTGAQISGCRGRQGQNGILLTRSTGAEVYDNDFSFLSGWGLALYRSSGNVVSHNIFDYCVRGYSHTVYWRGQDSAGILMFEQCSRNIIANNSATHSGDGVFLYAGNDLVERGAQDADGSDDNIFYRNDLRYAVANGLEATFSRGNAVIENNLSGAHQHGVWGGYSSDMVILGNKIEDTQGGAITIEHGQGCLIAENDLSQSEIGFEAYWDEDPAFVDGPFGRIRSTSSKDHWILANTFANNVLDLVVRRSTGVIFHGNHYVPGSREPYFESVTSEADPTLDARTVHSWLDGLDGAYPSGNLSRTTLNPWTGREPELLRSWRAWEPTDVPGSQTIEAEARDEFRGGLETIVMGEFGPWDFRSGAPRPEARRPGGLLSDARWRATWFRWEPGVSDPRTSERAWRACANDPLVQRTVGSFVNPWGDEDGRRQVGNDFFGLFASTTFDLERGGTFELRAISDDGIRVFLDDELVIENWTLHAQARDERTVVLDPGEHAIRLEYFQIQGAANLVVELRPRR